MWSVNTLKSLFPCGTIVLWLFALSSPGFSETGDSTATALIGDPDYCPAYTMSSIYRRGRRMVNVDQYDDWVDIVVNASPGTEILLAEGVYALDRNEVRIGDGVTLRSATGDKDSVVIKGMGYSRDSQGLVIAGDDVTVADISVTGMRDHGIYVKPELGGGRAPVIYNVHVYDIGTQHVKSNTGARDGLIACSKIGYSKNGAKGDYNGGIDLHGALAWTIRDNEIYNIVGDGSGCNVDKNCNRYITSPAILVWRGSRDTVVERNYLTDNFRNIAFGLGAVHEGGLIRNNIIFRTGQGDAGIELQGARGAVVENNWVLLYDNYRGAIEYRETQDIVVRFNRVTSLWDRGDNSGVTVTDNFIIPIP